jgi:RNA polymerase primary sigma factor
MGDCPAQGHGRGRHRTGLARHARSLEDFIRRASEQSLLDPEEELRLAERIDRGDDDALEDLVRPLVRIVIDEAIRYRALGCPQAELIRKGVEALVTCARSYSLERDGPLGTYAHRAVRAAMRGTLDRH